MPVNGIPLFAAISIEGLLHVNKGHSIVLKPRTWRHRSTTWTGSRSRAPLQRGRGRQHHEALRGHLANYLKHPRNQKRQDGR